MSFFTVMYVLRFEKENISVKMMIVSKENGWGNRAEDGGGMLLGIK